MIANFNLDKWPIVYFKLSGNAISENSFEEYKKYYLNLLIKCKNENTKMILICNLNNSGDLPLNYVMKQANFNKEIYKFNKEYIRCVCILCNNKNFKNILNLYFTVSRPAAPYKLCRSFGKINKYLSEKFDINFDSNVFDDMHEIVELEEEEEEKCDALQYDTNDTNDANDANDANDNIQELNNISNYSLK